MVSISGVGQGLNIDARYACRLQTGAPCLLLIFIPIREQRGNTRITSSTQRSQFYKITSAACRKRYACHWLLLLEVPGNWGNMTASVNFLSVSTGRNSHLKSETNFKNVGPSFRTRKGHISSPRNFSLRCTQMYVLHCPRHFWENGLVQGRAKHSSSIQYI